MAWQDFFDRGDKTAEIRLTAYLSRPDTLTADWIAHHDRSAAEMIASCKSLIATLTEYRQALAERYAALEVMPYRDRLELERRPDSWRGKIYYYVRIVRDYEDGTRVNLVSESYPGADRSKAFARFRALQKERPGIEAVQDTARRGWER